MTSSNDDDDCEIEGNSIHELYGGPCDGCRFRDPGHAFVSVYFSYCGNHAAAYERDSRGRIAFVGFRKMVDGHVVDTHPDCDFIKRPQSELF